MKTWNGKWSKRLKVHLFCNIEHKNAYDYENQWGFLVSSKKVSSSKNSYLRYLDIWKETSYKYAFSWDQNQTNSSSETGHWPWWEEEDGMLFMCLLCFCFHSQLVLYGGLPFILPTLLLLLLRQPPPTPSWRPYDYDSLPATDEKAKASRQAGNKVSKNPIQLNGKKETRLIFHCHNLHLHVKTRFFPLSLSLLAFFFSFHTTHQEDLDFTIISWLCWVATYY